MGALSINGIPALRTPFEPLVPEVRHVRNTNRYHRPPEETGKRGLLDVYRAADGDITGAPVLLWLMTRGRTEGTL